MSAPEPVTPAIRDFLRAQSIYDLEVTLVKFLQRFLGVLRLDNPALNLAQQPGRFPKSYDPDEPPVSFDPEARAQTLYLKVPPTVERGQVPRTVTGEIAVDKLPDHPSITVQAISARVTLMDSHTEKLVTVRVFVSNYDENPDGSGYQDTQNMMESIEIALTSFGQQGIDESYPIQLPLEWKLVEADTFPHFIGEMTTQWRLPSGRPMPDIDPWLFGAPGERFDVGVTEMAPAPFVWAPPSTENVPPYVPPSEPPPDEFITTFRSQDVNVPQNKFNIAGHGIANDEDIYFVAGVGGTLPNGILEKALYAVVNATSNGFQISEATRGAALVITSSGTGTSNEIWRRP
jgi:hypothetical protein